MTEKLDTSGEKLFTSKLRVQVDVKNAALKLKTNQVDALVDTATTKWENANVKGQISCSSVKMNYTVL